MAKGSPMAIGIDVTLDKIIDTNFKVDVPKYCKVCGAEALYFDKVDLGRSCHEEPYPLGRYGIDIPYYQCLECRFTFTTAFDRFSTEQWRRFIYNRDYVKVDPAFIEERPSANAFVTEAYLRAVGGKPVGLDFGGGDGLAASILRSRGWIYDSVDPFNGQDHVSPHGLYDFCTAFEVFEHVVQPREALADLRRRCSAERALILIGTNVLDGMISHRTGLDWWYAGPRNGHISLFSRAALKRLAADAGLHYLSLGRNLHFLSHGYAAEDVFRIAVEGKVRRLLAGGPTVTPEPRPRVHSSA